MENISLLKNYGELRNNWYVAEQSKNVKKKKISKSKILGVPLVLWRNKTGEVSVLLDRCSHRNVPLSCGKIIDDNIECPYHGWMFDKEGGCSKIPASIDPKQLPGKSIKKFEHKEENGLIWIWMGVDKAVGEPYYMPVGKKKIGSYYMTTDFNCGVTDLIENLMDVPHTAFIHKGIFRKSDNYKMTVKVTRDDKGVTVLYDQDEDDSMKGAYFLINPKKLPLKHTDKFLLPNTFHGEYIFGEDERYIKFVSICTPVDNFKTKVYTLVAFEFGWLNLLAKLFLPMYTRKVIDQDAEVLQWQTDNLKIFGEKSYKSSSADILNVYVANLRKWGKEANDDNKPKKIEKHVDFYV